MNLSSVQSLRRSSSPGSSSRSRPPRRAYDDLSRCQPRTQTQKPSPVLPGSPSACKDSKIPVRQSSGSALASKPCRGQSSNYAPVNVTGRSVAGVRGYESATQKNAVPSRIPRSALSLPGTSNMSAASDSVPSTPRRTYGSPPPSSPSLSPEVTPRGVAKTIQRQPSALDKFVPARKPRLSPLKPQPKDWPKDVDSSSAEPSPRERPEVSPAELIIRAFASSPLRSRSSSPTSKDISAQQQMQQPRNETAERRSRAKTHPEKRVNQPLDHGDALETLLPLPPPSRHPAATKTQQRDSGGQTSKQPPPTLAPAPKPSYPIPKAKRQPTTATPPITMSERSVNQPPPKITGKSDYATTATDNVQQHPDTVTTSFKTEETNTPSSIRNKSMSSQISKSTVSKTGSTSYVNTRDKRLKHQKLTKATAKTKHLSDTEKSSPRHKSTATAASSMPDVHQQNQPLLSTPAAEVVTDVGLRPSGEVEGDPVTEPPRFTLSLEDDDGHYFTKAKQKTRHSATSKPPAGVHGKSSWTKSLEDDKTATIDDTLHELRPTFDASQDDDNVYSSSDFLVACSDNEASDSSVAPIDEIAVESLRSRQRKFHPNAKLRGRSAAAAPARDSTRPVVGAAASDEEFNDAATVQPRALKRDLTWTKGSATSPREREESHATRDSVTGPPITPEPDLTWTEDSATRRVDGAARRLHQTADVVDHDFIKRGNSHSVSDARKLMFAGEEVRPPQGKLLEDDTAPRAKVHGDRRRMSSDRATGRKHCVSAPEHWHVDRPPSPSGPWKLLPHSTADPSPPRSRTDSDGEEDRPTYERDAKPTAGEMLARWMEIVDGYMDLLSRCRSFVSDSTMARRLTELRQKTAALIDSDATRLVYVVDPLIMRAVEVLWRRRTEHLGCETEIEAGRRREWMAQRAQSELSVVGEVAAALKRHSDDVSGQRADDKRCYNAGKYTGWSKKSKPLPNYKKIVINRIKACH